MKLPVYIVVDYLNSINVGAYLTLESAKKEALELAKENHTNVTVNRIQGMEGDTWIVTGLYKEPNYLTVCTIKTSELILNEKESYSILNAVENFLHKGVAA